jgi:hypothetical protein
MKTLRKAVAVIMDPPQNPRPPLAVVRAELKSPPVLWDPRTHGQYGQPATVLGHFFRSLKKRLFMKIDTRTAGIALPAIRTMAEQAKLATEYQNSLNALSMSEHEREIRLAELEQRKLELAAQRRQLEALEQLRLQKERLALQLSVATLRRQIKTEKAPVRDVPKLTPEQQKLLKRGELEAKLQSLRAEESKALLKAQNDAEKRRFQNMYAHRRERLMEELEQFL